MFYSVSFDSAKRLSQSQFDRLKRDLSPNVSPTLIMAEIYRKNGEWRVNAVGAGYQGGLQALLDRYQS